jgi:hypothetical protein
MLAAARPRLRRRYFFVSNVSDTIGIVRFRPVVPLRR